MAKRGEECPFSAGQMEALTAICDTLLPSIHYDEEDDDDDDDDDDDSVTQFFHASASMAGTPQKLGVLMGEKIEHPKIYLSKIALWLLSTWVGTFIMCGRKSLSTKFPYFQRFSRVSSDKRRQILISWSQSTFFLFKLFFTATKIFTLLTFFSQVNEKEENPSWKAIGYSRPNVKNEEKVEHEPLCSGVIDLTQCWDAAVAKLHKMGIPASTNTKPSVVIKCDVVVVGSGAGGGVVAGVLAKAGYKVVVLEKGKYVPRNKLSLIEGETMDEMYHQHGVSATENMDILLLAGSTLGGGTAINWSASIPTPPHVIREWTHDHKLDLFDTKLYRKALDVVCERMGVQSDFDREGFNNMVLRKGCHNLSYPVQNIPRNAPSDHYCGWCSLGCRDGKKKGVTETWLLDLVQSGNGAILPQCQATKVIVQPGKKRGAAGGVAFTFQQGTETGIVEARVTVVACGAICTPPLLKRSGLKNPNIGKNLHLHPVVLGWGYFPEGEGSWPEAGMKSYQGGIMTAMSNVVEETGYGSIIQTPSLHPGMFSALMPWISGRDIKRRLLKYSRTAHIFALARDRGSGEVRSESDVRYKMEESDRENLRKGMERVLRILAAAGAEEIGSQEREGRVMMKAKEASREDLERFVKEESGRVGSEMLSSPICSAHQMGSCRMGVDQKESAVNPKGETWEVEGLYVADSSVFPTALGVNPMVTIQAIAYCTAHSILQALDHNNNSSI